MHGTANDDTLSFKLADMKNFGFGSGNSGRGTHLDTLANRFANALNGLGILAVRNPVAREAIDAQGLVQHLSDSRPRVRIAASFVAMNLVTRGDDRNLLPYLGLFIFLLLCFNTSVFRLFSIKNFFFRFLVCFSFSIAPG